MRTVVETAVPGDQAADVERAVDALYASEPEGFVAGRHRLAAELRRAGRKDEARAVSGLRRPTLVASAIDNVALRAPHRVEALTDAGERLRRAHEEVVAGGDRERLQRAVDERRALIAALADEAVAVLRARGVRDPDAHRDEIEATFEAVSSGGEVAALVRRGRLVAAVDRPAGFGGLLDLTPVGADRPDPGPPEGELDERDGGEEAEALAPASEEATRLEEVAHAESAVVRAEAVLAEATADVERLETELAEARGRQAAAEAQVDQARQRRDAARDAAPEGATAMAPPLPPLDDRRR